VGARRTFWALPLTPFLSSARACVAGLPPSGDGDGAASASSLWVEPSEACALATVLRPRLLQSREAVRALLHEAFVLEAALGSTHELHASSLCTLLPRLWADFIRNGDMDQMR
jgi:hypothetical protein